MLFNYNVLEHNLVNLLSLINSMWFICNILFISNVLGSKFGTVTNTKGYKLLPPYLRVIQGDGISYESLKDILENMKKNGWSADNLTFGSGGMNDG